MNSLGEIGRRIQQAVELAERARVQLAEAADFAAEAGELLRTVGAGSSDPEFEQVAGLFDEATTGTEGLVGTLASGRSHAERYLHSLELGGASTAPDSEASFVPDVVRHADGSKYAIAASWAVDRLPRRVREGERSEQTVGQVMLSGREFGPMTSGRDETWSSQVGLRMRALRIRTNLRLENHVEMKVAEMMIQLGDRSGMVVINHAPCGSQRRLVGCHQVLERYLPQGYSLTVHGTTQQGQPFSHTYRGQA